VTGRHADRQPCIHRRAGMLAPVWPSSQCADLGDVAGSDDAERDGATAEARLPRKGGPPASGLTGASGHQTGSGRGRSVSWRSARPASAIRTIETRQRDHPPRGGDSARAIARTDTAGSSRRRAIYSPMSCLLGASWAAVGSTHRAADGRSNRLPGVRLEDFALHVATVEPSTCVICCGELAGLGPRRRSVEEWLDRLNEPESPCFVIVRRNPVWER
jgi:hypothetical protein